MNRTKNLLVLALVAAAFTLAPAPAKAQYNQSAEPTTVVLTQPQMIIGAAVGNVTNSWVDVHGFSGIATITFVCVSNVPGGTMTATVEASTDAQNQIAFGSYQLGNFTTQIYTNYYYGTNGLTATNKVILPGSVVTPTAATAGFATPYLLANPFTNSGAVTVSGGASAGAYQIAFNIQDTPRYLRVIWSPGGSTTNSGVSAILRARKSSFP